MINLIGQAGTDWAMIGAFWASVAAAVVAVAATVINYLFFRAHIDPHVIVYVMPDEQRPSIILLVIENIGNGLAKDVRFTMSRPLPERAFGFGDAATPAEMKDGPLITGIPALGPGAKRVITWGQYGGIHKGIGDNVINVTVRCKSDRVGPFDQTSHEVVCPVDIRSFAATDASDKAYDKKIADDLHRIATTLDHAASGFKPIKVELREPRNSVGVRARPQPAIESNDAGGEAN
jgi:hypothetical protein